MGTLLKKVIEILQGILNYEAANHAVLNEIRDLLRESKG